MQYRDKHHLKHANNLTNILAFYTLIRKVTLDYPDLQPFVHTAPYLTWGAPAVCKAVAHAMIPCAYDHGNIR